MGRRKKNPLDPMLEVDSQAISAALRVWGGSLAELSKGLAAIDVGYSKPSLAELAKGATQTAPQSVVQGLAQLMLGDANLYAALMPDPKQPNGASIVAALAYRARLERYLKGRSAMGRDVAAGLLWRLNLMLAVDPLMATRLLVGHVGGIGGENVSEAALAAITTAIEQVALLRPGAFDVPWYVDMLKRCLWDNRAIALEVQGIPDDLLREIEAAGGRVAPVPGQLS